MCISLQPFSSHIKNFFFVVFLEGYAILLVQNLSGPRPSPVEPLLETQLNEILNPPSCPLAPLSLKKYNRNVLDVLKDMYYYIGHLKKSLL